MLPDGVSVERRSGVVSVTFPRASVEALWANPHLAAVSDGVEWRMSVDESRALRAALEAAEASNAP